MVDASRADALRGVPETMLWTLHHRAAEARRPDTVLPDPRAVRLVEAVDFPFVERFGHPHTVVAQAVALRAGCFDAVVRDFLRACPEGTVVSLGEGLETAFWRVDNGTVDWLTVDLPEPLALRYALLPHGPRQRTHAGDARDLSWTREVDRSNGVLVLAQGLLMYFRPPEVRELIAGCAEAFPGGSLVFDAVPRSVVGVGRAHPRRVSGRYRLPPMPWRMDAADRPALRTAHPGVAGVADLPLPPGRGLLGGPLRPDRIPVLRGKRPSVTLLRFAERPAVVG
ncbi:class I SAM-dependent methyltransferase [Streptacidiphilus cavernicola]|uniref:Class I SAM-dependent methyltransferase n=1 Tax=Streptacidiphilus cavernicola TaxID=3342716 RepID=A0ABV6VQ03_9ACTN